MQLQQISPPSQINLGNYTLCNHAVLGKGASGVVYKGYRNSTLTPVAIKAIDLSLVTDDATRSLLQNQKNALKIIQGQHVLKLLDIIETNNFCYIVTELYPAVTLKQYLLEKGKLSEEEAMSIFKKILIGCNSIIQNCIIHRDLKPANILISSDQTPTIIDFGFCEIIRAKKVIRSFNVGSPSYMSPEAYLRTLYSEKSDSWSLGVILYEMIHGKTLDNGKSIKQFFQAVKNNVNYISQNLQSGLHPHVIQILEKSFKFNTQERISVSAMKYLTDVYLANKRKEIRTDNSNIRNRGSLNSVKFNSIQHPPLPKSVHTLQSIQNEFKPEKHNQEGFISFAEFSKAPAESVSLGYRCSRSIQMRVSSTSKQSSNNRNQLQIKTNQNLQNKISKQHPKSFYQTKMQYNNELAREPLARRFKGPPVFRHVTVKYL